MKLYKFELFKILNRKFTWAISAVWLAMVVFMLCQETGMSQKVIGEYGQTAGYRRFLFLVQLLICFTMVWLSVILSPFFCEDRQNKMDVLIMTSMKGKLPDFMARIGVVLTLVFGAFFLVLMLTFGVCHVLYGYFDRRFLAEEIFYLKKYAPVLAQIDAGKYIAAYLLRVISALLMLAGIIVWISAKCSKTINALIITLITVFCPLLLTALFAYGSVGDFFISGQPMILIIEIKFWLNYATHNGHLVMTYLIMAIGILYGGRSWCIGK